MMMCLAEVRDVFLPFPISLTFPTNQKLHASLRFLSAVEVDMNKERAVLLVHHISIISELKSEFPAI